MFFAIWVSTETEDFFLKNEQTLLFFRSNKEIDDFCRLKNIEIVLETFFDFDSIDYNNYDQLINLWNIISDLSKTLNLSFIGNNDEMLSIYKKILCACNLPALNNTQEKYIPHFSKTEFDRIELVLLDMKDILEKVLLLK